jgi:nucleoside-diphosphate-sugar epimerase
MKIAVVGSKGYVGGLLTKALLASSHGVTGVTRENYRNIQKGSFDILINCAMPSGRFWAKNNPEKDFVETVEKTANLLYGWKFKKFVQISTVSARCQLDTVYGRHKAAAEKLCDFGDNLVVRLGALYGGSMKKGVLVDMLEGKKVYVDGESRYSFVSVDVAAEWIAKNLHRNGTIEFGGKNAIALQDVARHLGKDIEFEGELNHQDIESPEDDFPEARDVIAFLDSQKI